MADQYLTIPNILSLLRILLLIPILFCFYSQHILCTLGLFLASAVTDILDGIIARRWRMESRLGRIFDPLADKVTFVTLIVLFGWHVLWRRWLFALVAAECILLLMGAYTYLNSHAERWFKLGANSLGKAKACCETVLVISLITWHFFAFPNLFYLQVMLSTSITFAYASIVTHIRLTPLT